MRDFDSYKASLARSSQRCGTHPTVGVSTFKESCSVWNARHLCGRWECPRCGKLKRRKLRRRVKNGFTDDHVRLMTLTTSRDDFSIDEAVNTLSRDWDMFCKRLRRRYPGMKYFKIVEWHRNGRPHLHILLNTYIPKQYISKTWAEIRRSPITDIKSVGTASATRYATKYMTKAMDTTDGTAALFYLFRRRRFSFSQNFLPTSHPDTKYILWHGLDSDEARRIYQIVCKELMATYKFVGTSEDDCSLFLDMSQPP